MNRLNHFLLLVFSIGITSYIFADGDESINLTQISGVWNFSQNGNMHEIVDQNGKKYLGNDESIIIYKKGNDYFLYYPGSVLKMEKLKVYSNSVTFSTSRKLTQDGSQKKYFDVRINFFNPDTIWLEITNKDFKKDDFEIAQAGIPIGSKYKFYRGREVH